jgi:hypothetical protein
MSYSYDREPDVSEEHTATTFVVQEQTKLVLHFDWKDENPRGLLHRYLYVFSFFTCTNKR